MYTDVCETKQGAGSRYVILSGKDRVLNTQSINLTGEASIFQAELIAIQEAAKDLYTHEDTPGLYIKFFSDSQAALQALKSNNFKAQTVKDTHEALNALAYDLKWHPWAYNLIFFILVAKKAQILCPRPQF